MDLVNEEKRITRDPKRIIPVRANMRMVSIMYMAK